MKKLLFAQLRIAGKAALVLAAITAYTPAFAARPVADEPARAQWRESMLHKQTPGIGCFQAAFPAERWLRVQCHPFTGKTHPLPRVEGRGGPETVGNGNDYALVAPGGDLITQAVGSFPSVVGVTSESSVGVAAFGGGGVLGANEYTLQINTNSNATTSACSGGAAGCKVWEQFLYAPDQITSGKGGVFIQYWLLGWGATVATTSCPGSFQQATNSTSCFVNSAVNEAPDVAITGLGTLQLTATAASGGNDSVTFSDGGTLYNITAADSVLSIATVWNQSEFNIVGDAGGSDAIFNAGSVVTVNQTAQYGSTTAPTCASGAGTTGETNNLNLLPCTASGGATPSVQFTEVLTSNPTISKAFSPTSIIDGGTSTVTLTLTNPNVGLALTGASFTDTLFNMTAQGGAVGGTCAGTTPSSLSAGATALSFSGITIPASGSCTVTFVVTSIVLGVLPNSTSGVSSNQALTGNASNTANLTVTALPASISKAFSPTTIVAGAASTVTLTLTNPNVIALTSAAFTDTLVTLKASGGSVGGTCSGTTPGTLSAGATALSFSGITIPASSSCTVTFNVTTISLGTFNNSTSGVATAQAATGSASNTAKLTVIALPATISKAFMPANITTISTSSVTLTLHNPNVIPLTGAAFTDAFVNMSVFGTAFASTCSGITPNSVNAGATAVVFSGITLPSSGNCTITFTVVSTHVGTNPNTTSGVSTVEAVTGNPSNTANLIVIPGTIYISDSQNNRTRAVNTVFDTISTFAGNGTGGFTGDGGAATSAEVKIPFGVAVDPSGNVYIADSQNNRVRSVSMTGIITTVAGNGSAGSTGDGGPAISASLNNPTGVAVDAAGNVYIADQYNNKIRVVDTAGVIHTFAGTGITGSGGDGGPAASAALYYPSSVSLDGLGNLYIADTNNQRIRKVVISTTTITTAAGSGSIGYGCSAGGATAVGLHNPFGVVADGFGNLFIADTYNQCVRKVAAGNITTLAGNGTATFGGDGGPATSASLNYPSGVAVDGIGDVYIADLVNNRVRMVTPGGTISTLAGTGIAGFAGDGGAAASARTYNPTGVAAH